MRCRRCWAMPPPSERSRRSDCEMVDTLSKSRSGARQPYKRIEKRLAGSDVPTTTAEISARMARVRRKGTTAEVQVRRVASALALRFTTMNRDLPGAPDLANRRRRYAIFVHGCFWHRHRGCYRATTPKTNRRFWIAKFRHNVRRDHDAQRALRNMGFRVAVVWECECDVAAKVHRKLSKLASVLPSREANK
jgi:DNA mismatch endonuclease Vsr